MKLALYHKPCKKFSLGKNHLGDFWSGVDTLKYKSLKYQLRLKKFVLYLEPLKNLFMWGYPKSGSSKVFRNIFLLNIK